MNEDLSFYLSFAGFSVGVLALSCTLVLLFGRGGARKILGWTFGLLIIGTIATVAVMWIADARQRSNQLSWQKDPIITPAPQPAPAPQRPLSDAEVGLAANNTRLRHRSIHRNRMRLSGRVPHLQAFMSNWQPRKMQK